MLVGCEFNNEDKLVLSHYGKDGKLSIVEKRIREEDVFNWVSSDRQTPNITWDKTYIEKSKSRRLSRFRMEELMNTYLNKETKSAIHEFNKPKVAILDIEVYVNKNNDFPSAELALFPINLITVLIDNTAYVLTTLPQMESDQISKMNNELNDYISSFGQKINILYQYFPNEKYLLECFCNNLLPKLPFITGWNVIKYDWLYIYNRCEKNKVVLTKRLPSQDLGMGKIPIHTGMIDYIDAMKAFTPIKDLENHKLDTVAYRTLGVTKFENPYNSFYEFIQDTYKFTLYNIIDTVLIKLIDANLNMMGSSFAICNISELEVSKIFSSVYMTEIFLCREFYKKGIFLPNKKISGMKDFKYTGAYVKEPIPGFYELISCFDFNSMYPNIAVQFNISPETYLGFFDKINPANLPEKWTKTIKGTVFDTTYDSTTRILLTEKYNQRKVIQKQMEELEFELETKKNN